MSASMNHMSKTIKRLFIKFRHGCSIQRFPMQAHCSTMVTRNDIELDTAVEEKLNSGQIQPKSHPGLIDKKAVKLPNRLIKSIKKLIDKYPTSDLHKNATRLQQQLWSRHRPMEADELTYRARLIEQELIEKEKLNFEEMSEDDIKVKMDNIKQKVFKKLRYHTYHWTPIEFSAYKAFLYLVGRGGLDYSSLHKIFTEIKSIDRNFQPESLYDSGSGVGTVTWAANAVWSDRIQEHYCVDPSADMNTIARLLMQDASEDKELCFPNVYFRQFAPTSRENTFDLVVSAYTLLELPNQAERIKYLLSLWRKTQQYLVLVELGTNAGFHLITEARDFLIQMSDESTKSRLRRKVRDDLTGHVALPCPHDLPCPRFALQDNTPCNFPVSYYPPVPLTNKRTKSGKELSEVAKGAYSYVVLKRGARPSESCNWPRLVRESSLVSGKVHCRMCTSHGELQHSVITAKAHGKLLYKVARKSNWGDRLPIKTAHSHHVGKPVPVDEDNAEMYYSTTDLGNAERLGSDCESSIEQELGRDAHEMTDNDDRFLETSNNL